MERCCDEPMSRTEKPEKVGGIRVTWFTLTCSKCGAQETGRELPKPQYSMEDLDAIDWYGIYGLPVEHAQP